MLCLKPKKRKEVGFLAVELFVGDDQAGSGCDWLMIAFCTTQATRNSTQSDACRKDWFVYEKEVLPNLESPFERRIVVALDNDLD